MDVHNHILQILVICLASTTLQTTIPQVHEAENYFFTSDSNTRIIREPSFGGRPPTRANNHQPPTFDFQSAVQQDHRRNRYAQQQRIDFQNIFRNGKEQPDDDASATLKTTEKLARASRKLRPADASSYHEDFEERQDNSRIIYVHPDVIKKHFSDGASERDISALNALIGQSPSTQLEGLKKLLEATPDSVNFVLASRDHTPITEDAAEGTTADSESATVEEFQKHLDVAAQEHAQKVLDKAKHDAAVHVEAQHRVIAKMQVEAQNAALGQINNYYHPVKVTEAVPDKGYPLALPLIASGVGTTSHYVPSRQQAAALLQAEKAVMAQVHAQNSVILNKVSAIPPHKISITHSITQERKTPSNNKYQQIFETKHNIEPTTVEQKITNHEDHFYASRYAFGYRIKDFKKGNDFGHEEKRDGKSAKGHYHVLLPDGRMQKVEYYADPTGYHAKVTYENVAHHKQTVG